MGVFTAFIVALFTEMYGFPLTVFILTSLLGSKYPALDPFSHKSGHLLLTFLGGGAMLQVFIHLISNGLMLLGFVIMGTGWRKITIATLASWPILMGVYYRLAKREEREMEMRFGENYLSYKKRVPGFFPFRFHSGVGEVLI
jgi:hypothetical protein